MNTKSFDIISIGDTTIDVFLDVEEATVECDEAGENCKLQFNYADKLPVEKLTRVAAVGNAANNAIGSSRLGLNAALFTILGDDASGRECLEVIKEEGVADDYIQIDKESGTNYSTVINFDAERTILVYHEDREYSLPEMNAPKWAYFSSLAAGHDKLHTQIPEFLKENEVKLGFNPGTFQLKEGKEGIEPILEVTEVLLLNREEGQRVVGEEDDIKKLLDKLAETGPKIVVVTDGPEGSYTLDTRKEKYYFMGILDGPVVERTGAGDAFSTGFIAALANGEPIPEAIRWGTTNSWQVLQHIGAREGLLTKDKMIQTLKDNPDLQPEEI